MRRALIITALLLAGCNNAGNWENQQAELANELNASAPAAEDSSLSPTADDVNATSPAANDANAVTNASDNLVGNEVAPPPAPQE